MDEAGRGPLAGPVSAAAVILDPARPITGLADSKKLKPGARDALAPLIRERALAWGHAFVWPDEIETLNIHHASLQAMARAFADLSARFPRAAEALRCAVADGKFPVRLDIPGVTECAQVKGDDLVQEISAASIIAKTARDDWMKEYARTDSRYGFDRHFGYPVPEHRAALERFGPCPIHRMSWVRKFLGSGDKKKEAPDGELPF